MPSKTVSDTGGPRDVEAFVGGQTQLRSVIVKYYGKYI